MRLKNEKTNALFRQLFFYYLCGSLSHFLFAQSRLYHVSVHKIIIIMMLL